MTSDAQWMDSYTGLIPDEAVIPLMGVRMVVGVTSDGIEQCSYIVEGNGDSIKAVFMLDMIADVMRDAIRQQFGFQIKVDDT